MTKHDIFKVHSGISPLLISLPHDGSEIPEDIQARMQPGARSAPDTDWHVSRLYSFAMAIGATIIQPKYSRYVIDLNRPPDDVSLYPGQNTTGLCPMRQFSGEPVYLDGHWPSEHEIKSRIEQYWRPYHQALTAQIQRLHEEHGRVLLWEGHSIKSQVPFLFDGVLPDFNLGTVAGVSCKPSTQNSIQRLLSEQTRFTSVSNGRFKGGYITRNYHDLANNVETVQLELSQATYMDEESRQYDQAKAEHVQATIHQLFNAVI